MDPEHVHHNIFLAVNLEEGPSAEVYYFTPDSKVETYPNVYQRLPLWERRYRHADSQKGIAWDLWIHDCDLLAHSKGNSQQARHSLLAVWRERYAWNDAGKEWYQRITKIIEDAHKKEMAELADDN